MPRTFAAAGRHKHEDLERLDRDGHSSTDRAIHFEVSVTGATALQSVGTEHKAFTNCHPYTLPPS